MTLVSHAETPPVVMPVLLDLFNQDATLAGLTTIIGTEIPDSQPLDYVRLRLVDAPDTDSDLPETVAVVQADSYAATKVDAQALATRIRTIATQTARYTHAQGILRGLTVLGESDTSELETGRFRFTQTLVATVHRPA